MFAASKTAGVSGAVNYIEDVFSTYLYTGTGATQTITNSIDTTTYGGLVWIKGRSGATGHRYTDTSRGVTKSLASETTAAEATETTGLTAFGTTGFTIGSDADYNTSADTYASWTFRKQAKFFDVVTYTGTGSAQTIAHNLGSVPGCIIVKRTDAVANWAVYHRSLANTQYLALNASTAAATSATWWNSTTPTSTVFTVGSSANTNFSGGTYVAYIFAHNAGGFGLTGTDNVISCGSYTGTGATGNEQTLGFEPQFLLIKNTSATGLWVMVDIMRKITALPGTNADSTLYANSNAAEDQTSDPIAYLTPTGFGLKGLVSFSNASGNNYIYIAIRRGPMKVPTDATKVFSPLLANNSQGTQNTTGFPVDLQISTFPTGTSDRYFVDRLRGVSTNATNGEKYLASNTSAAEATTTSITQYWNNTGFQTSLGNAGSSELYLNFRRAPSFFDEVCYTGTGANTTVSHNLGVAPELMLVKIRSGAGNWAGYSATTGAGFTVQLNSTVAASASATVWNSTSPTASVFSVGTAGSTNGSGSTFVAYLFATCAGVSKVGSYTGNGTTQTIDCGLTAGARFVLIRRTDAAGSWYVYDTARGMTVLTDPYVLLNSTGAEVATLGSVTTVATGFAVNSAILAAINVSAGTYIFLAIA
jgi:hypothetical protein